MPRPVAAAEGPAPHAGLPPSKQGSAAPWLLRRRYRMLRHESRAGAPVWRPQRVDRDRRPGLWQQQKGLLRTPDCHRASRDVPRPGDGAGVHGCFDIKSEPAPQSGVRSVSKENLCRYYTWLAIMGQLFCWWNNYKRGRDQLRSFASFDL